MSDPIDRIRETLAAETRPGEWRVSKYLEGRDIRALLDRLKDLESNGSQAVRWAPSSAHWSSELRRLFGADARDGIDALEQRLRDAEAENERLRDALEAVVAYRTGGLIERLCREALEDTDAR